MDTVYDNKIASGFAEARKIAKAHGKIFYFASLFLPREKQDATCVIYAVCMKSDEAVDNDAFKDKRERLAAVKEELDAVYNGLPLNAPLLAAFRYTVESLKIPRSYFDELLEGMSMDLNKGRYADFQELSAYCYKVAGIIGLIMLKVFDCRAPEAQKYAIDLGFALQLTNIIRDVKEDWGRGRVYLPQEEIQHYGAEERDIEYGIADYEFKRLIEFQTERARGYYSASLPGLSFISEPRLRFVIRATQMLYASILDEIEQRDFDVFSGRPNISLSRKAYVVLASLIKECL